MNTTLNSLRTELAVQNARGITFIAAATVYWLGLGIAGLYLKPGTAFIASIWGTGIVFPLSVLLAKIFRVNIFFKNELTPLGVWANIFQLFFFPVLFALSRMNVYYPPVFMGVLVGAHFVFYYWLYQCRTYLLLAFAMAISSYALGFLFLENTYAVVGFSNAAWLCLGVVLLGLENRMSAERIH